MLHKLLRRFRVSEVHLCLPFVQITMEAVSEEAAVSEPQETNEPKKIESVKAVRREPLPIEPVAVQPLRLSVQERSVPERSAVPGITVTPLVDSLYNELSFRVATAVDTFGPIFPAEWHPLSSGLELRPGDYLWLRLYCRNHSDRVAHNVRIAMEGIEIARKQCGILVRGVNGWPRVEIRDVTAGHEVRHINPGEDYSLHCVLRVPTSLPNGKRPQFSALKPEFNILKQLG